MNQGSVNIARATAGLEVFFGALNLPESARAETDGSAARVARLYAEVLCAGYNYDALTDLAQDVLATSSRDRIVIRDLQLRTTCPHHLLPAVGTASVWLSPGGSILGLGAYGRALSKLAARLVLQETLAADYADALFTSLNPSGVLVCLELSHGCMVASGECAEGSRVRTLAARGDVPESAYVELAR